MAASTVHVTITKNGNKNTHINYIDAWPKKPTPTANLLTVMKTNQSHIVIIFCISAFVVYLLYSYVTMAQKTRIPMMHSWKDVDEEAIPRDVWRRAEEVDVQVTSVVVKSQGQNVKTRIREVTPNDDGRGMAPVLLLHGASFSSKTWHDLGTLKLLGAMGHRAVAIDLPGYGDTPAANDLNKSLYLRALIRDLDMPKPVIVTASMSGGFAIPYVMAEDPETAWQRAKALVAIAPVSTKLYEHHQYNRLGIPVLIIRGEKDVRLGLEASSSLQNAPSHRYVEFPGGGHACYMDDSARWHLELYRFLVGLRRMESSSSKHQS